MPLQESGQGKKTRCTITKTKDLHEAAVKLYNSQAAELADVRSLL
jgi:hypothetical protein